MDGDDAFIAVIEEIRQNILRLRAQIISEEGFR